MDDKAHQILATADVRRVDARAIDEFGVPGFELMTRAAQRLVDRIQEVWPESQHVCIVAGAGNNGGDGYVAGSRLLALGRRVHVVAPMGLPLSGDARAAYEGYCASGGRVDVGGPVDPAGADLILDALFGTGLSREIAGVALDAIRAINTAGVPILSADMPSGLASDTGLACPDAVFATETVTFVADKPGFYLGVGPDHVGRLTVAELDIPAAAWSDVRPVIRAVPSSLVMALLPRRRRTAHKGDHGRVILVGGGPGMPGAIRLAGEGALRAGAGLVTLVTHPSHAAAIAMSRPELICLGLDGSGSVRALFENADVVAIGPGLGQSAWARDLFHEALDCGRPLVVDADALNLLAAAPVVRDQWILTPHPGEAGRLLGRSAADVQADRLGALEDLVSRYGATVVLKGARSLIGGPGQPSPWVCRAGNPGMATAGMGDVLTGIIAAIAAQQRPPGDLTDIAAVGAQVHAMAGDSAAYAEAYAGERGLLAGDLLGHVRKAVNPCD